MPAFRAASAYRDFEHEVIRSVRYVRSEHSEEFLRTVAKTAKARVEKVPFGVTVWRAQVGHGYEPWPHDGDVIEQLPAPFPVDRMMPPKDRAPEGRANPKGIPYLYVATDRDTAMAEVRPSKGSLVSVAAMRFTKPLRLVNCTEDSPRKIIFLRPMPRRLWDKRVWSDIDDAFARPIERSDDRADYTPTQIIAEFLKRQGYDGIAYRSGLGSGHNIVLFDVDCAEVASCHLFRVKHVTYEFKEDANPYFVKAASQIPPRKKPHRARQSGS